MSSIIQWLQDWTKTQIDGDWEHELGISISLLDNPGWILSADVSNQGNSVNSLLGISGDCQMPDSFLEKRLWKST